MYTARISKLICILITGILTPQLIFPGEIDPDALGTGGRWSGSACSGENSPALLGLEPWISQSVT